jgi:hypothetical protein
MVDVIEWLQRFVAEQRCEAFQRTLPALIGG